MRQLSRRKILAAFAATAARALTGSSSARAESDFHGRTQTCTGPSFSATGPNAELYGVEEGYPLPDILEARRHGDPWEPKYRVGAFTHLDQIYPTRLVERAAMPVRGAIASLLVKIAKRSRHVDVRAPRERHLALPVQEALTGDVDRDERRGTRRHDGEAGTA